MLRKIVYCADVLQKDELDKYPEFKVQWDEFVEEAEGKIAKMNNYNLGRTEITSNRRSTVITNVRFKGVSFKIVGPTGRLDEHHAKVYIHVLSIERFARKPKIVTWTKTDADVDSISIKNLERFRHKDIVDLYIANKLGELQIDEIWIMTLLYAYLWKVGMVHGN